MSELPASLHFFTARDAPPVARLLGWTFEDADVEEGTIAVSFTAKDDFTNPAGDVQGGILAAMLDDALGPAVVVKSGGTLYAPTIQLDIQFLRPVKPGPVRVEARCVQLGRTIAFMEGRLYAGDGTLSATATATARVTSMENVGRERVVNSK